MAPLPFLFRAAVLASLGLSAGCASGPPQGLAGGEGWNRSGVVQAPRGYDAEHDFAEIGFATWTDNEPEYRLYPGDVLDVGPLSAPELNRTVTVQPDGRVSLPLLPPLMAADRSIREFEGMATAAYSRELVRPEVAVSVKQAMALKVFVGGEVDRPGVYDMPGDIDALQAVIMAGGFKTSARRSEVIVIRRGPGGRPMMRTVDLRAAIYDPGQRNSVPLRRFDVIYVPRSGIANIGVFVQQYFRDALPIQFSYALNRNTVIQ
jgi:polysaccharide export outer membrane protein